MRSFWVGGAVALCLVGGMAWTASSQGRSSQAETFQHLGLFNTVLQTIESKYVTEVDTGPLIESAIEGMLTSLDPHSGYLNAEEFRDLQQSTSGEYEGIGIEVTGEDGFVKVVAPIDNSPASRAGLLSGDRISAIDGESIVGLPLNDAVQKMRGPGGTEITITVNRAEQEPFDVTIVRARVVQETVTWRVERNSVGYVRIATFNEKAASRLEEASRDLRRQAKNGLSGIVLDLRTNPGGLLDQAVAVADMFLDGGEIVSTRGRDPSDYAPYNARRGEAFKGLPVVVLINAGSASASEIVAGALQDLARAKIVGVTSFGKGSVQTVLPLQNGAQGALRLTTGKYYTPSGRSIQETGIEPDVEVSAVRVSEADIEREEFSEGALRNALRNESGEERRKAHIPADQPPENWPEERDYQLERALDVLQGRYVLEVAQAAPAPG